MELDGFELLDDDEPEMERSGVRARSFLGSCGGKIPNGLSNRRGSRAYST